ncbi:hypothetical protein, partial [Phascolarctobacterium faecium]|uniref:hypothetical protein n=1 Tax=Phascolarctobacterium faecium TaxID=33025 RepID=UPI003076DED0
ILPYKNGYLSTVCCDIAKILKKSKNGSGKVAGIGQACRCPRAIKKRIPERNASMAMVAPAGFEPATF